MKRRERILFSCSLFNLEVLKHINSEIGPSVSQGRGNVSRKVRFEQENFYFETTCFNKTPVCWYCYNEIPTKVMLIVSPIVGR